MARNYTVGHVWDVLDARAVLSAATEIEALRARLKLAVEEMESIAEVDDDGWTSDGHERCTEGAARTLASIRGETEQ